MSLGRRFVATTVLLALATPAGAINFELGENASLKMVNKFTIGAGVRTQDYHSRNLGILNVPGQQDLCHADDCVSFTGDPVPNQNLLNARGGFFLHAADDGDMNYDRGDYYTGISKLNADWTLNWDEWTFKTNFVGYYDVVNRGFTVSRNNTVQCTGANPAAECNGADGNGFDTYTLGPAERARSGEIEHRLAVRGEFREYFVTRSFMLGDYEIYASVGNQRLRWGEANLTLLNTLDVMNPQDAVLARQPGLALNELNLPVGMLTLGADVLEGVSVDGWWQYDWEPVRPEPSGSLLSNLSDVAGGGDYAVVGLGQYPEDPDAYWFSEGTTGLISNSHRTIFVPDEESHAPDGLGQYGLRVKWYLPDFNNGTEFGFYFANYHSRLPYASVTASQDSCMRNAANMADAATRCNGFNAASNRGEGATLAPERCDPRGCNLAAYTAREPLPIDTMGLFLDFPENIQMYGLSFNTTLGGWSVAGEYSYRPNVPAQLLLSDVVFAALQPAVPRGDIAFAGLGAFNPLLATPDTAARVAELLNDVPFSSDPTAGTSAVIPGASTIFPCYLCAYRGYDNGAVGDDGSTVNDIVAGEYIRGYERIKLGQFALTMLQLFSTNPFGSDDLLFVYEVGFQHVVDMPEPDPTPGAGGLFFQGSGDQSHPSQGADCTGDAEFGTTCTTLRINPTQQRKGFADDFAWGMRTLIQLNYSNLFDVGLTVKPTVLAFWDVNGIAPAPQQNFVEGNRWIVPGLFFEYGSDWSGTLLYQYFAGRYSMLGDRDNIAASITYAF
jgi:hypothetical protein